MHKRLQPKGHPNSYLYQKLDCPNITENAKNIGLPRLTLIFLRKYKQDFSHADLNLHLFFRKVFLDQRQ